jgi:hypothetical protein
MIDGLLQNTLPFSQLPVRTYSGWLIYLFGVSSGFLRERFGKASGVPEELSKKCRSRPEENKNKPRMKQGKLSA